MPAQPACERARAILHASSPIEPDSGGALNVLKALSRGGAVVVETDTGFSVTIEESASSSAARNIPPEVWRNLLHRGWCVPHETQDGWRISNAGRIALKRGLTRKGAPDKCAATHQGLVRASSSPPASSRTRSSNTPLQNDNESPLTWLRQRRDRQGRAFISEAQFAAGERLRRDFTYGNMTPTVTSSWSPVAFGSKRGRAADAELELRDGQLRARERFRAAMVAVGPEFCDVLADVCCFLLGLEEVERKNGWPRRTAKIVLQLGLSALARFYGMEGRQDTNATGAR